VITVGRLDRFPQFIPALADAFAAEWPEWARTVSRADLEAIFTSGAQGLLPVVLAAWEDERVLGTIALRPWFGDEAMQETPWVRQLFVMPESRGRGVDRVLAAALEAEARELGFTCLYAATNRIERLLARRGWALYRRVEHDGHPMAWLRKAIADRTKTGDRPHFPSGRK
jgi:GNAT superfamily N-acetyltransferase